MIGPFGPTPEIRVFPAGAAPLKTERGAAHLSATARNPSRADAAAGRAALRAGRAIRMSPVSKSPSGVLDRQA